MSFLRGFCAQFLMLFGIFGAIQKASFVCEAGFGCAKTRPLRAGGGMAVFFLLFASPLWAQNVEDLPIQDPAPAPNSLYSQPGERQLIEERAVEDPTPITAPHAKDSHGHRHDEAETFAEGETKNPDSFIYQALCAGLIAAGLLSYLGLYVVARRMVFLGVALAEISSTGIALGLWLGFAPLWGALGFVLLGVLLLSQRYAPRKLPPDAPIGVFYTLATAASILMIAHSARGEGHMLTLLRGDVLAVYPHETLQMALVFALIAMVHLLFGKEFLLVSLDREVAATLGYRAGRWNFLLFLTFGLAVALAIRSVGVLLTTALLLLPAATALLLVPRWKGAATLAPVVGMSAVGIGLWLSLVGDFPTSAVIVAVLFGFFAPVLAWHTFK